MDRPEQLKKVQNEALELFIKKNIDYGMHSQNTGLLV
jgi:hypothetical protein